MLFLPWVASTQAVRNDLSRSLLTCILILYRVIWYLSYIDILVYTWWITILYIFMLNKFCLSPESWVLSHISYCIQMLGTAAPVHNKRVHVLQKTIVRIICGVHPWSHTEAIFEISNLLSINQFRPTLLQHWCTRWKNKMIAESLGCMFTSASEIHNHSTKSVGM